MFEQWQSRALRSVLYRGNKVTEPERVAVAEQQAVKKWVLRLSLASERRNVEFLSVVGGETGNIGLRFPSWTQEPQITPIQVRRADGCAATIGRTAGGE